jgi:hypothetical protein
MGEDSRNTYNDGRAKKSDEVDLRFLSIYSWSYYDFQYSPLWRSYFLLIIFLKLLLFISCSDPCSRGLSCQPWAWQIEWWGHWYSRGLCHLGNAWSSDPNCRFYVYMTSICQCCFNLLNYCRELILIGWMTFFAAEHGMAWMGTYQNRDCV